VLARVLFLFEKKGFVLYRWKSEIKEARGKEK